MAKILLFSALLVALLFAGCCGSAPQSTFNPANCPYGTYGETCTTICNAMRGTEYDAPNCFSECTDFVRSSGEGDATTCCQQTIRQGCASKCSALVGGMVNEYGELVEQGEAEEMLEECNAECLGAYASIGVDVDSVCHIPISEPA